MTEDEELTLDEIKRDIIYFKKSNHVYKKVDWFKTRDEGRDDSGREEFVNAYIRSRGLPLSDYQRIYDVMYICMTRAWKVPGWWGEHGIEGMNMTS